MQVSLPPICMNAKASVDVVRSGCQERLEVGEEPVRNLQMWDMAALGYDHPFGTRYVRSGLLGESFEVAEPASQLRRRHPDFVADLGGCRPRVFKKLAQCLPVRSLRLVDQRARPLPYGLARPS